ncbi:MAG TPA: DUF523 domain-containing protein [Solibacterales bacterium]|nr:DUF523 domain-containing protein [Bryobacterales bacterium]
MKVLVSACLLGEKVRYDGRDQDRRSTAIGRLLAEGRAVAVCPEVAGGLGVPRLPSEIQAGDGAGVLDGKMRVLDARGGDVTAAFVRGAEQALAVARDHGIRVAILKSRSPSCGNAGVYDGTFQRRLIPGRGVTAELLERHGVRVFSEDEIEQAMDFAER